MKKHYTTPEVEIIKVNSSEIICTSVGFGEGDTPIMYSRGRGDFDFEDEDGLWFE